MPEDADKDNKTDDYKYEYDDITDLSVPNPGGIRRAVIIGSTTLILLAMIVFRALR